MKALIRDSRRQKSVAIIAPRKELKENESVIKGEKLIRIELKEWALEGGNEVSLNEKEKEAFYLIQTVFILESIFRDKKYVSRSSKTLKVSNPEVTLEMKGVEDTEAREIENILGSLFSFSDQVDISLTIVGKSAKGDENNPASNNNPGSVCLFSGGIDSVVGLLTASLDKSLSPVHGLFVTYGNGSIVPTVRQLSETLASWHLTGLKGIYTIRVIKGRNDVQQLRGFVFTSLGILLSHRLGLSSLRISEIGPVMFQPTFNALDEVTITTHPYTIELSKRLMKLLLNVDVNVETPFDNNTKAEIVRTFIKASPVSREESELLLKRTFSCRNPTFVNSSRPHCGYCLGCTIRRSALLLNGIENQTEEDYRRDVWIIDEGEPTREYHPPNSKFKIEDLQNIYPLLEFSVAALTGKLEEEYPFGFSKIKRFNKEELYSRFALDNLATLYLLYDKLRIGRNSDLKRFHLLLQEKGICIEELEDRLLYYKAQQNTE